MLGSPHKSFVVSFSMTYSRRQLLANAAMAVRSVAMGRRAILMVAES
jgi:hypothetical protein